MKIGAAWSEDGSCSFRVWAPFRKSMAVKVEGGPGKAVIPLEVDERGYWQVARVEAPKTLLYTFILDGELERPDPASHWQPRGVHGASALVDHRAFRWSDGDWRGLDLGESITYELHTGTFTPEGTFDAAIGRLDDLATLGVTAVEVMPVAQFPGERSWGYDGVYLYAVQDSYGGPTGLKHFVNECHRRGLSVILDVVYNHFGPEGSYIGDYGPYFTDRCQTPWGKAINFADAYSNEVRNFFIENALHWLEHYHVDGLRLDAIHGIYDPSARPFLAELADRVADLSRGSSFGRYLIAESDLNDPRVVRPVEIGGFGLDAQWSDDIHHALHVVLTGEKHGYYADFGTIAQLVTALREGYVYQGQYSSYRKRNHGSSTGDVPPWRLVAFTQNHDQVGNRMNGERLASLVPFEALKLAAGVLITSQYLPLLFMGEEHGEAAPFCYFVDHSDPDLIRAVRSGRKDEFKAFNWEGEPPNPDDRETYLKSKIDWNKRQEPPGSNLLSYYSRVIRLRREVPCLGAGEAGEIDVYGAEEEKLLVVRKRDERAEAFCLCNFDQREKAVNIDLPQGKWEKLLDSSDASWAGPGPLLPDRFSAGEAMRIAGYGFAIFLKTG